MILFLLWHHINILYDINHSYIWHMILLFPYFILWHPWCLKNECKFLTHYAYQKPVQVFVINNDFLYACSYYISYIIIIYVTNSLYSIMLRYIYTKHPSQAITLYFILSQALTTIMLWSLCTSLHFMHQCYVTLYKQLCHIWPHSRFKIIFHILQVIMSYFIVTQLIKVKVSLCHVSQSSV